MDKKAQQAFQKLIDGGIISSDDAENIIKMSKREEARKKHTKNITPPKSEGGKWMTWVDDPDTPSGRRKIVKKTENDLLDALYDFYFGERENMTLESFYPNWFTYKQSMTACSSTLRRHEQHYKKYYEGTPIVKVPLRKLDAITLTTWAHNLIKKHNLSSKEFQNMKIIMSGSLELALAKGIIQRNPWKEVKINPRFFRVIHKKPNKDKIFLEEELVALKEDLKKQLELHPDCSAPYAILLQLQLGARIGELMALKFSDIEDNYIHIQRMERKVDTLGENGKWQKQFYEVVDHVKTHNNVGERHVYLTESAKEIIEKVRSINSEYGYSDNDYIFVDSNGRMNARQISCRLERYCGHIGLNCVKSSHSLRRTVASNLSAGQVPLDEIRRMLGHANEQTTLGYIFNPYSTEKTEHLIQNALDNSTLPKNTQNDIK